MENLGAYLIVIAATLVVVAACVLLQYELLTLAWRRLSMQTGHRRIKVLYGIFSVLGIHLLEILVFGTVLWILTLWPSNGALAGEEASTLFDYLYFSAITFSTVGFGESWPTGAVRFLCAMEALSGFVLITWSASFTYLEMERFWRPEALEQRRE